MDLSKEHIKNYITKINCFVSCLQNHKWIKKASEDDINLMFQTADDLEQTLKRIESTKFKKKLEKAFPNIDLTKSSELLLEILLTSPACPEDIVMHGIDEFLIYHTHEEFSRFLCKCLANRKLKSQLIYLNQKFQPKQKKTLGELETISIFYLWEELLSSNREQLRKVIIEKLNNKSSSLLAIIDSIPVCRTSNSLINIIVNYLEEEKSVKIWGEVLMDKNLDLIVNLCNKYSSLALGILNFLNVYESEVQSDFDEELNMMWNHKDLEFNQFIKIIQRLLEKDGAIKSQLNEYLDFKKNDFDANFTFWTDVYSYV